MTTENNTAGELGSTGVDLFSDPRSDSTWFFDGSDRSDLNIDVTSVWEDYTGTGVKVGVVDTQIDFDHEDLERNYDQSLDFNFTFGTGDMDSSAPYLSDNHGTMVAGVIASEGGNGTGGVGYAPDVTLVGLAIDYSSSNVTNEVVEALKAAVNVDVVNNSWSFVSNFADNFATASDLKYAEALEYIITEGREGLGTSIVFSAGNGGSDQASNYHNFQNSPYVISVGAVERSGIAWDDTSLGANVLVSAAGHRVNTTTVNDKYTVATGTSFAAPAVTSVVALMLEANPNLGYRDVQQILALSAVREGLSDTPTLDDNDNPLGIGWITNAATNHNGGGMHFSDAFGYGIVNAHNAVRLAETWTKQQSIDNLDTHSVEAEGKTILSSGIADEVVIKIEVDKAMSVEHVQMSMSLYNWSATGDLDIFLVSPSGTTVQLLYERDSRASNGNFNDFTFSSVGTMGEMAEGTWEIHVINNEPGSTDNSGKPRVGTIEDVTLTIHGDEDNYNDDVYVYTDEFGTIYSKADLLERSTLKDTDGGIDDLNASAVTSDSYLDLSGADVSVIAGIEVTIINPHKIENLYGGDGNDTLIGHDGDNVISGGRGKDVIYLSGGDDTLMGGAGTDWLIVDEAFDGVVGYISEAGTLMLGLMDLGFSAITGIEVFEFSDVTYDLDTLTKILSKESPPEEPEDPKDEEEPGDPDDKEDPEEPDDEEEPGDPEEPEDPEGPEAPNVFKGAKGADLLFGSDEDDMMFGYGSDDTLRGGEGDDTLSGGSGSDFLVGGIGDDSIVGGGGEDRLRGGFGEDTIDGGGADDRLWGHSGDDSMDGGVGDDHLNGGSGDDTLNGGEGADVLLGGSGADVFVFDLKYAGEMDVIRDFNLDQGDEVHITGLDGAKFELVHMDNKSYFELVTGDGNETLIRIIGDDLEDIKIVIGSDNDLILT